MRGRGRGRFNDFNHPTDTFQSSNYSQRDQVDAPRASRRFIDAENQQDFDDQEPREKPIRGRGRGRGGFRGRGTYNQGYP